MTYTPIEDSRIYPLAFRLQRPFVVMMEDCIPAWSLTAEKMTYRKNMPLAAALEIVEYGIYNLHKIEFGG